MEQRGKLYVIDSGPDSYRLHCLYEVSRFCFPSLVNGDPHPKAIGKIKSETVFIV